MQLLPQTQIMLGAYSYTVREHLGRGAVSDVYAATAAGTADELVIKLVRADQAGDPTLQAALRAEAKVLDRLNRDECIDWPEDPPARLAFARGSAATRYIVALLDNGDFNGEPFLIQEYAPPPLTATPAASLADELRALAVGTAIADVMARSHRCGYALSDFSPELKRDRIRMRWDATAFTFELKIIDWNISGDASNSDEVAADLLMLGGHLYYLLTGNLAPLDDQKRPAGSLALAAANWRTLSEGSRWLLQRLLHRDPQRRFPHAQDVLGDLRWWTETLRHAVSGDLGRLKQIKDDAQVRQQTGRLLAVAALGAGLAVDDLDRRLFEQAFRQAREELEREDLRVFTQARISLKLKNWAVAERQFRELAEQDLPPETIRRARIYERVARTGRFLEPHGDDALAALDAGATALQRQEWSDALWRFQSIVDTFLHAAMPAPLAEFKRQAEAGLQIEEALGRIHSALHPAGQATDDEWVVVEGELLAQHAAAVEQLRAAARLLQSDEPGFAQQVSVETERYRQRQAAFQQVTEAERLVAVALRALQISREAMAEERYRVAGEELRQAGEALGEALQLVEQVQAPDRARRRAAQLQNQILRLGVEHRDLAEEQARQEARQQQVRQLLDESAAALAQGRYVAVLAAADQALPEALQHPRVRAVVAEARAGAALAQWCDDLLAGKTRALRAGQLGEVEHAAAVSELRSALGAPFGRSPVAPSVSPAVADAGFKASVELRAAIDQFAQVGADLFRRHEQARVALAEGRYGTLRELLAPLTRDGYRLPADLAEGGALAEQIVAVQGAIEEGARAGEPVQRFASLRTALALLDGGSSLPAALERQLRERVAQAWLAAVVAGEPGDAFPFLGDDLAALAGTSAAASLAELAGLAQALAVARGSADDLDQPQVLAGAARNIAELERAPSLARWPAAQALVGEWRARLNAAWLDYARRQAQVAGASFEQRRYGQAQAQAREALDTLPAQLRDERGFAEVVAELERLKQRASQVGSVTKQWLDRMSAIGTCQRTFTQEEPLLTALIADDLPPQVAEQFRQQLRIVTTLAGVEQRLDASLPVTGESIKTLRADLERVSREPATVMQSISLAPALEQLRTRLQSRIVELALKVASQLAVEADPLLSGGNHEEFLRRYHEVLDVAADGQLVDDNRALGTRANAALNDAQRVVDRMVGRLVADFTDARLVEQMANVHMRSADLAQTVRRMYSTDASVAPQRLRLLAKALDQLAATADVICKLDALCAQVMPEQVAEAAPWRMVREGGIQVRGHLNALREWWPDLAGQRSWSSGPEQLDFRAYRMYRLAEAVTQLNEKTQLSPVLRLQEARKPDVLNTSATVSPLPEDVLSPAEQHIRRLLNLLNDHSVMALRQQINAILRGTAREQALREHVLAEVQHPQVARLVADLIGEEIKEIVDNASPRSREARPDEQWRAVYVAVDAQIDPSRPERNSLDPEVLRVWEELYKTAREHVAASGGLAWLRRPAVVATALGVLLVALLAAVVILAQQLNSAVITSRATGTTVVALEATNQVLATTVALLAAPTQPADHSGETPTITPFQALRRATAAGFSPETIGVDPTAPLALNTPYVPTGAQVESNCQIRLADATLLWVRCADLEAPPPEPGSAPLPESELPMNVPR